MNGCFVQYFAARFTAKIDFSINTGKHFRRGLKPTERANVLLK